MRAKAVNDRTKLLMFSFLWFRIDAYFHVIGIEIRPITSEFRNAFWLEGSKMCICAIYWWLFSENLTPQMKFYATSRAYSNRKHIQVTTKLFKKQRKVRVDNLIAFVWCGELSIYLTGKILPPRMRHHYDWVLLKRLRSSTYCKAAFKESLQFRGKSRYLGINP